MERSAQRASPAFRLGIATAALVLGVAGCATARPAAPAPSDPVEPGRSETPATVTAAGSLELHELGDARLLAEAEPAEIGMDAQMAGALSTNERGCFGVRNGDAFVTIVFPHGTTVTGAETISYRGEEFSAGDELAFGGGSYLPPVTPDTSEEDVKTLTVCGYADDYWLAAPGFQLLADFERQTAQASEDPSPS